jgi:hypothetical protein
MPLPALLVTRTEGATACALSPSGSKLAVATEKAGYKAGELKVMDLRTGVIRTWTSSSGAVMTTDNPIDMSWAADNTTLAFSWGDLSVWPPPARSPSGLWLLDTARPGGDLLAEGRRVLAYRVNRKRGVFAVPGAGHLASVPVLTPDGRTFVVGITSTISVVSGYFWFAAYDAVTGRLERIFDRTSLVSNSASQQIGVLWTSPSGNALVVSNLPGHVLRVSMVSQSGHVIVLPFRDDKQMLDPGPAW